MYPFLFSNLGSIKDFETGEFCNKDEIFEKIKRKIIFFQNSGVKEKNKVLLLHGNNIDFFVDIFALWQLNVSVVCLDENIGIIEFKKILEICSSKFIVIKDKKPKKIKNYKNKRITFLNTKKIKNNLIENKKTSIINFKGSPDDIALILFTSGTTGEPKGVVHSFRSLTSKWISLKEHVPLNFLNNSLCLLPTNFGHGLICNCLYPLLNGKRLVILPKFNLKILSKLHKIIDDNNITYMSSVPSVWRAIFELNRKKPKKKSLRLITCGSAPLSGYIWSKIQKWASTKRVWNTYGITETGSWIAGTQGKNIIPRDGLIGKSWGANILISDQMPQHKKCIFSLDADLKKKDGQKGYLWIQTSSLMREYLGRKKLTQSVVIGTWFFSGDVGYIDKKGNIIITGRIRNEINTNGIKVTPEDIDLILEKNPKILESCTFGIADQMAGQLVAAAIVIKKGIKLSSNDLFNWTKKYVSDYKVPKVWFEAETLPKTARGKINREQIAKSVREFKIIK